MLNCVPHHHHPTQKLLHAQKGTLFQHLCLSKDLEMMIMEPVRQKTECNLSKVDEES